MKKGEEKEEKEEKEEQEEKEEKETSNECHLKKPVTLEKKIYQMKKNKKEKDN